MRQETTSQIAMSDGQATASYQLIGATGQRVTGQCIARQGESFFIAPLGLQVSFQVLVGNPTVGILGDRVTEQRPRDFHRFAFVGRSTALMRQEELRRR